MPSARGSSRPRDRTHISYVSCIGSGFFTISATRETLICCSRRSYWSWNKSWPYLVPGWQNGVAVTWCDWNFTWNIHRLEISYFLFRWLLGGHTEGDKKAAKVQKLSKNEVLMVNTRSLSTGGRISAVKADLGKIVLTNSVCMEVEEKKITLSQRVEKHWHSIGWAQIGRGVTIKPTIDDDWRIK